MTGIIERVTELTAGAGTYEAGDTAAAYLRDVAAVAAPLLLRRLAEAGPGSGQSYVHNNGFAKLSLARWTNENGTWALRLHVWPAGHVDTSVHNHRWPFWAAVLRGALTTTEYAVTSALDGAEHRYALGDADDLGRKRITDLGPAVATALRTTAVRAGETHQLPGVTFHRVATASADGAITACLTGPVEQARSHVVRPTTTPPAVQPVPLGRAGVADLVHHLIREQYVA